MATFTYIPEGNLRLGFSGTAESLGDISRLFDYNVESINPFTAQDFTFGGAGLSAVTSTEDYGLVTDNNGRARNSSPRRASPSPSSFAVRSTPVSTKAYSAFATKPSESWTSSW